MYLELSHLSKSFGARRVLHDLSLGLERGELACILGASGCGKTTTLNLIGGFLTPDEGQICLDGADITRLPPEARPVTTVFQSYALFPHMTVLENVIYGLKFRGVKKAQAREKGRRYLELVGLEEYAGARIHQISGGQQQRVALARILAGSPEILMLDEPFSALDAYLRVQIQTDMQEWLREFGKDVLLVSHNRDEIYRLCGSLAVMDRGRILGKGPVKQMFRSPGSRQGAVLTGCRNIVEARKAGEHLAEVPAWGLCLETEEPLRDDLCAIGIRAHYFSPEEERNSGAVVLEGEMEEPFEWILKFRYETAAPDSRPVWWRIPKERRPQHFPKRLGIAPEQVMPLYR